MYLVQHRWRRVAEILRSLESCAAMSARLDAYVPTRTNGRRIKLRDELDRRLDRLALTVDREIDRLTAERLLSDLARKQDAQARLMLRSA